MNGNDKERGEKRTAAASLGLGWMGGSSVQPRKRRDIQGVGAGSLVGLRAQVAKKQQESKQLKLGSVDLMTLRRQQRGRSGSLKERMKGSNPGVEQRRQKDEQAMLSYDEEARIEQSRASLERKAQIYERMSRGEVQGDEEYEEYEVDFLMKPEQRRDSKEDMSQDDIVSMLFESRNGAIFAEDYEGRPMIGQSISERRRNMIAMIEQETREGRALAKKLREERARKQARKRKILRERYIERRMELLDSGYSQIKV